MGCSISIVRTAFNEFYKQKALLFIGSVFISVYYIRPQNDVYDLKLSLNAGTNILNDPKF